MKNPSSTKDPSQTNTIVARLSSKQDISSILFKKYHLAFNPKTLISKTPSDETLTLVIKMLQITLKLPRQKVIYKEEIPRKTKIKTLFSPHPS